MLEYISNNYYMLLYALALTLSIVKYHLYFDTLLKHFPILIAYTLLSELLGIIVRDVPSVQIIYELEYYNYNTIIFNIFDIVFFIYFYYVYYHLISHSLPKKIIKYGSGIFVITFIFNFFIQDFYVEPQNYAIIVGAILLLFAVLTYFYELFKEERKFIPYKNLLFWISLGILFFYSCYPVTMYFLTFYYELYSEYNLSVYHRATIGVFYFCIIIGFILMKRLRIRNTTNETLATGTL